MNEESASPYFSMATSDCANRRTVTAACTEGYDCHRCFLHPPSDSLFEQRCNTHIATHGARASMSGATLAATSQFQLNAAPAISATAASANQNLRAPRMWRRLQLRIVRGESRLMELAVAPVIAFSMSYQIIQSIAAPWGMSAAGPHVGFRPTLIGAKLWRLSLGYLRLFGMMFIVVSGIGRAG